MRIISQRFFLYTEMVTTGALIHGPASRLLRYDCCEHPIALQLGGSHPADLASCAKLAQAAGYDEVNLNVGCPSDRVQSGRFGACLMLEPGLVAECIAAMCGATELPVTVKCRIGVDDQDAETGLSQFVETVAAAGCGSFIVHARKAWLKGLNPKQNRDVPPLDYDRVWRLKQARPDLNIIINGGIQSLSDVETQLAHCDGVMLGRLAYEDPYALAEIASSLDGRPVPSRLALIQGVYPYWERQVGLGEPVSALFLPVFNLWKGVAGGKQIRKLLNDSAAADALPPFAAFESLSLPD